MRPAVLALVVSGLAAAACSSSSKPSCPGEVVARFHLEGRLVLFGDPAIAPVAGDPAIAALDPFVDCTLDAKSPVQYPPTVAFDAELAADPTTSAAALCRPNGVVYAGERTGTAHYSVSAEADPAILCSGVCAADFRVVIAGDVAVDAGGAPTAFQDGILVEVLTASRGVCDACLPLVPEADPPERACAARYALSGTVR